METAKSQQPRDGVRQASWVRVAAVWLISLLVRAWCRTLRFELSPGSLEAGRHEGPCVILVWHNRLFTAPWVMRVLRTRRPVCGLVSASRDGATLAAFFRFIGMRAVRGSSSRLGREALHDLIAQYRAGNDVALTPDGPRGPIYSMSGGALLTARRVKAPILLLGFEFPSAWRLRSWDAFYIPKPFSQVLAHMEILASDSLPGGNEGVGQLHRRLLEINGLPATSSAGRPDGGREVTRQAFEPRSAHEAGTRSASVTSDRAGLP